MVYRWAHFRITLKDLVEEIASAHIDTLFVKAQLPSHNLLLQLHRVVLLKEWQRAVVMEKKEKRSVS